MSYANSQCYSIGYNLDLEKYVGLLEFKNMSKAIVADTRSEVERRLNNEIMRINSLSEDMIVDKTRVDSV